MYPDNYALVDCNNFFVSCERVFDPSLRNKPVAVLSNNDGCIVARSNEVKALKIPMGAPVFEWQNEINKHKIQLRSSNFSLYQDMSERVFRALSEFCEQIEVYSVDEAFLRFVQMSDERSQKHLQETREKVYQWTGIPISIGCASTKTLSKLANHVAKKFEENRGVYKISNIHDNDVQPYLTKLDLDDIWGIGYRIADRLKVYNISTISDFLNSDPHFLKQKFGVQLERTWLELHGTRCHPIETNRSAKKGILCSRSFKKAYTSYKELEEAVATFSARACASMRKQNSLALSASVFITTGRHAQENYYSRFKETELSTPSSHTPTITKAIISMLKDIYVPGLKYKRAGVYLTDFFTKNDIQQNMFDSYDLEKIRENKQNMETIDELNSFWGKDTLMFGNQRINRPKIIEQSIRSARFTTNWREIPLIKCRI